MATRINPFNELYSGDIVDPEKFVSLFSDKIVKHALPLFQPGHIILKGLPGTGKSMLLNLLRSSIRIAYATSGMTFPVPKEFTKFIGAGINLIRSGINEFGQRPIDSEEQNKYTLPIYFGDFLNYWLVEDILASIAELSNKDIPSKLRKEIGINFDEKLIESFAVELSKLDCWHNYLVGIKNYFDLRNKIHKRITEYRAFLNYNIDDLSPEIRQSKTHVGIPVSKCVELLRAHQIIEKDVEVYIRIDQYEELTSLDEKLTSMGTSYQDIIHKLLGIRDPNVSYRIGTRHHSWSGYKKMFGTDELLEKKRNYKEISIDAVLRRTENQRTWIFPKFAEDIFKRRIKNSTYKNIYKEESLLSFVFGKGLSPNERASLYVPNDPQKAIRVEDHWPENWTSFLRKLALKNPLSARLGEAWARQKGKTNIVFNVPDHEPFPWDAKLWWRKERIEQALLQIASRNQQQLCWFGKDDIIGLSGGNILSFLSLCQHIWDVWLRDNRSEAETKELKIPNIDNVIQSAGIRETSYDWFIDLADAKGGRERQNFISYIGTLFYQSLVEDKAMSYPGHNGFSLRIDELQSEKDLDGFLKDASDYGDLYDAPHTTKSQDKKQRRKWYLNPILSPYFKIPYSHTKEPKYIDIKTLRQWIKKSRGLKNNNDLNEGIH